MKDSKLANYCTILSCVNIIVLDKGTQKAHFDENDFSQTISIIEKRNLKKKKHSNASTLLSIFRYS